MKCKRGRGQSSGAGVNESGKYPARVEITEVGVEVARGLLHDAGLEDRVAFVQADGMSMPFDDASFDIAISMNVMNVFEDKVALFREVRRLLRPGGTWAFLSGTFEFGPDDQAAKDRLAAGYAIPQYTDTLAGYKAKLIEAGFVIDEVVEYISDFRDKVATWREGWIRHRDAIAAEVPNLRQHDDAVALQRALACQPVVIIGVATMKMTSRTSMTSM